MLEKSIGVSPPKPVGAGAIKTEEEALERLQQAQTAITQLKRDNDALNAQAQRLDSQNKELLDQLARAESDERKIRLSGLLINSECSCSLGIWGDVQN